ncbi:MAG: DUF4349 domain-containing protein [Chloroflexota bacterium]
MNRFRRNALAVLVLAVILVTGCSAMEVAPPQTGDDGYYPGDEDRDVDDGSSEEPAPGMPEDERPGAPDADSGNDVPDRLVVRNGSMEVVVDDVGASAQDIGQIADTFGGHVVSSSVYEDDGRMFGSVAIRVDADSFDSALEAIRSLAVEVTRENTSARDVTEEYIDLTARVRNLERTEEQLQQLMEEAESVEVVLEVQRELTDVRGQIEQLEGRIRYLEQTTATSLIEVSLRESVLTVSFSAETRLVDEGQPVRFESDVSGGFSPYSYEWSFGDGETSNEANPTHIYDDEGWHSIRLSVTDDRGAREDAYRDYYIEVRGVWSPLDVFEDAASGLGAFARWLLGVVIWLLVFTPLWAALAGITYLIYRMAKRGRTAQK